MPSRLQHRPLLDVELEVGAQPVAPRAGLGAPDRARRRCSASTSGSAAPSASRSSRDRGGVERSRERRAAEQAAPEAGALLVGPVDEHERRAAAARPLRPTPAAPRRRPSRPGRRRASRRRARSRGASRPRRRAGSRRRPARAQRFPASSTSGSTPISASSSPRNARASRQVCVQQTRWAPSVVRRCGASSSRRSAITRAGVDRPARGRQVRPGRGAAPAPGNGRRRRPSVNIVEIRGRTARARARASARSATLGAGAGRDHPVVAQRHRVHAQLRTRPRPETSRISNPLPRSQRDEAAGGGLGADRGELRREDRQQHVDVDEAGRGSARPGPPSPRPRSQPASWRAAGISVRSSPFPITTHPGSTIITSPPSIAPAVAIRQIGIPLPGRSGSPARTRRGATAASAR